MKVSIIKKVIPSNLTPTNCVNYLILGIYWLEMALLIVISRVWAMISTRLPLHIKSLPLNFYSEAYHLLCMVVPLTTFKKICTSVRENLSTSEKKKVTLQSERFLKTV